MTNTGHRSSFDHLPAEVRRMIWDLAAGRHPHRNFFASEVIPVNIIQELRFIRPKVAAAQDGKTPEGWFRYAFYMNSPRRPHFLNFITRETYNDYLDRYPDVLELRGDVRTRAVRFNAEHDNIFMDVTSLFALVDFATPRGSPTGVGGVTGQGPPALERRQRLLNFNRIERLEYPLQDDRIAGIRWLRGNVLTGLRDPPLPNQTLHNLIPNRNALRTHLNTEVDNVFFAIPRAERPRRIDPVTSMNTFRSLTWNRSEASYHFFCLPPGVVHSGGGQSSSSGPGPSSHPEDNDPDYIPPPFEPRLPGQLKTRGGSSSPWGSYGSSSQNYSRQEGNSGVLLKRRRGNGEQRRLSSQSYCQGKVSTISESTSTVTAPSFASQPPFRLMALPYDLRIHIWAFAAGRDPQDVKASETLQVRFRARLVFEGARGIPGTPNRHLPARLHYLFDVTARTHAPSNFICQETRELFLQRYPNTIHLPSMERDGPPTQIIRFNAAIDTIFMDVPSLLALYDYSRPLWNQNLSGEGPARNRLVGFNLIQRLATPHVDNAIRIDWLRANVLTSLQHPLTQDLSFPPNIVGYWAHEIRINRELNQWYPMNPNMARILFDFRQELYPLWQAVLIRRMTALRPFFIRTGPGAPPNSPHGFNENPALI